MKNFYLAVPLALAMSGCVDNPPDIQIFNAFIPDVSCAANVTGPSSGGGSLDISTSPRYLTALTVRSGVSSTEVIVEEGPITGGGDAAAVYVTHVELTYETLGTGPTLDPDIYPSHFAIPSTSSTNSVLVIDLLGANARQALLNQLAVGSGVSLNVRVKLTGKTVTGSKAESNEIAYPVNVFSSGFTCPAGTQLKATGPCGLPGGQDGFPPECTEPEET
ncbi:MULTISPECIES: hypothetical protein [Myxococcus]|uniref:hypothetical protein n=1 Tax=Myxococcus TaxID=32 RepID=UPI001141A6ED|nr:MULTISPECIES: hypothetical protein [Myxococcus]NOK02020.1 hypothetical protein [Myxococcus xanthus]